MDMRHPSLFLLAVLACGHAHAYENNEFDWLNPDVREEKSKPAADPLEFARIKLTGNDFEPIFADGKNARLLEAARRDNLAEVKQLVKTGASVNAADRLGWRPLVYAVQNGNVEMVRLLLDNFADPDAKGGGYRPLGAAALDGHLQIARMLIRAGAHLDLRGSNGNTPLIDAAFANRPELIQLLLKHGADPALFNSRHWTALSVAAMTGNLEAMESLLAKGVDPNLLDGDGNSAMYWATNNQREGLMSLLSRHGGKVVFSLPE